MHSIFGEVIIPVGLRKQIQAIIQDELLRLAEETRHKGHSQDITEDAFLLKENRRA